MASRVVLDAGAGLGAAALVVSIGGLIAQHAPGFQEVADSGSDSPVATDLRQAELVTAGTVVVAGAVASLLMRQWWPLAVTLAGVGAAVGIYEAALAFRGEPGSLRRIRG